MRSISTRELRGVRGGGADDLPCSKARERAAVFAGLGGRGLSYALKRQDLVGTYVVDIVAMAFSMPNLLVSCGRRQPGRQSVPGLAPLGHRHRCVVRDLELALVAGVRRHGLMILLAAGAWSACMVGFGLSKSFPLAMTFLLLAGYADMVSAVFRQTIWNQTIPDELRGRLAGIEMISYLTGPLLGNTQLGFMASAIGIEAGDHALEPGRPRWRGPVRGKAAAVPTLPRAKAREPGPLLSRGGGAPRRRVGSASQSYVAAPGKRPPPSPSRTTSTSRPTSTNVVVDVGVDVVVSVCRLITNLS